MSRHKVQKSSFGNNAAPKKSSSLNQASSWTNPYQQRNAKASEQPINTVKPPTAEEWLKDNIMLRAIETRQAQLQRQQLEENPASPCNPGTEPQQLVENVQMKCAACESPETEKEQNIGSEDLQFKEDGTRTSASMQQMAATGFNGSATKLPHLNQIQHSFGVDLSHVQAYIAGKAAKASQKMGAAAYASGNQIAFKEQPSLELAAHEAAHIVQQQSGRVQLAGGVGQVGDKYEQHADAVAQRVGAGQSAKDLLAEYSDKSAEENIVTQASEVVQQQVIAPPPVALPPVLPPATGIPPILAPAAKVFPWIAPLVIPGGLLNPLPTANDQIDPRTGQNRFKNQTEQPQLQRPTPATQGDRERASKPKPVPSQTNSEEPCTTEGLKELKNCNSIKDKIVRRGIYPPETPYGQYRYHGLPGQASSYALGALINRIKKNRGSISGRIQITKTDPSLLNIGLCPDGGGSHHEVRDEARQYVASIICCKCCQKDPKTQEEKKSESCAILPKKIVPDAGELAPQGALPKGNSSIATLDNSDVVKQV